MALLNATKRTPPAEETISDLDLARLADEVVRKFDTHPDRQAVAEQEHRVRGELERVDHDYADAPRGSLRALTLSEQRDGLRRELAELTARRGAVDSRAAADALATSPLRRAYAEVVAAQARRLRDAARANDALLAVSQTVERAGLVGGSYYLRPMICHEVGLWSDESSAARRFFAECIEHGFLKEENRHVA